MKIALVGGTGRVGSRVAREALDRGHAVRCLRRREVDLFDPWAVAQALRGQDVLVSAYGAPADAPQLLAQATRSMVQAARAAAVRRIITVGGAGGLAVRPGMRLADTDGFPSALLPKVKAHEDAAAVLAASGLDWTCLAPAAQIGPGERTARYRLALRALVKRCGRSQQHLIRGLRLRPAGRTGSRSPHAPSGRDGRRKCRIQSGMTRRSHLRRPGC
jgi:putative NADH-flavin reductase